MDLALTTNAILRPDDPFTGSGTMAPMYRPSRVLAM
jgi:hypothetical protein